MSTTASTRPLDRLSDVAIRGASVAMAIAAVLPRNEHSERNLPFTVPSVTVPEPVVPGIAPVPS